MERERLPRLGLATKTVNGQPEAYSHADENALTFTGFLLFFDPPKADVQQVIVDLAKRGVQLKIITGDNQKVARHVAEAVNLPLQGVLTGSQLNDLRDEALWHLAERTTLFAEVDSQPEGAHHPCAKKTGHVVGYMGDGINDARPCTRRMWASPWTRQWMWLKKLLTLCC